jgi:SAM-dependent methyltransferase
MNYQHWNAVADKFEHEVCDITSSHRGSELADLVGSLRLPRTKGVLVDLGCGLGTFIREFGGRFGEIIGVEFAPRIVARAKKRCRRMTNVEWLTMSLHHAPPVIGPRADLVACMNVVTSPSAARRDVMFASIAAITKPRGFALVVVPSVESAEMVRSVTRGNRAATATPADGIFRRGNARQKHFAKRELADALAQKGLIPKRVVRISYPWSEEGLSAPKAGAQEAPWDWACVAQRAA